MCSSDRVPILYTAKIQVDAKLDERQICKTELSVRALGERPNGGWGDVVKRIKFLSYLPFKRVSFFGISP